MGKTFEWLRHIETSIPKEAYGYPVSMYSVALEGWRRGLSLEFRNNYRVKAVLPYTLSGYGKAIEFSGTRSEFVSRKAINICMNKEQTKAYLMEANIVTPVGKKFYAEDDYIVIQYAETLGYPLVLKPTNASGGKGVIANIKNKADFIEALDYIRNKLAYKKVIVEEYVNGKDYRLYVIGDEVVGAFSRTRANVTGDGESSIRELLKLKRIERSKNPGIHNQVIKIEKETLNLLREQGYTIDSVPEKGMIVYLKTSSNISTGGDSIDATDDLPSFVKKEAVRAIKAIPGLLQGGVDVLYEEESGEFSIIEVNSQPSIRAHLFPMQGQARDIPKAIIDYYFPETIGKGNMDNLLYYFDINTVFTSFNACMTNKINIPNMPTGKKYIKKYQISCKVYKSSYGRWIQKQARAFRINGYVRHTKQNSILVFCVGSKKNILSFEKRIKETTLSGMEISSIFDTPIKDEMCPPIKIGFEIVETIEGQKHLEKQKAETKKQMKKAEKELHLLKREIKLLQQERKQMLNSTSWKITKPIRLIGSIKNKLIKRK